MWGSRLFLKRRIRAISKKLLANPKLVLPIDSIIKNEVVLDHGPNTVTLLSTLAQKAKTILWNGPLGNYENGFTALLKVSRARLPRHMRTPSSAAATPSPPLPPGISGSCHDSPSSRPAAARCSNFLATGTLPALKLSSLTILSA